jgi:hypothetical protein
MSIYLKVLLLLFVAFALSWDFPSKTKEYCKKVYNERKIKVFLKDESIESVMMSVEDRNTKRPVFGYYVSAIRNDTNFIYSKFENNGDTLIIREYHDYKISYRTDSVIRKYLCSQKGLSLFQIKRYWEGTVK